MLLQALVALSLCTEEQPTIFWKVILIALLPHGQGTNVIVHLTTDLTA